MNRQTGKVIFSLTVILIAAAICITPKTTQALTFNYTFESGFEQTEQDELELADNIWEYALTDDVTVNVLVGWGDSSEMGNVVAHTENNLLWMTYPFMRDRVVYDESQESIRNGLVRWLPSLEEFSTDTTLTMEPPIIWATQAQWKALGLTKENFFPESNHCDEYNNCWNDQFDATIRFNPIYFDSSTPDLDLRRDFQNVAVHELGHVLGFISAVDFGISLGPTVLDMYRFERDSVHFGGVDDDVPTTLAEFQMNERNLDKEGNIPYLVVDYNIDSQTFIRYRLSSTNRNMQASHWFELIPAPSPGGEIGIMDPGSSSFFSYDPSNVSIADEYAMDLIGWELNDTIYNLNGIVPLDWDLYEQSRSNDSLLITNDYSSVAAKSLADVIESSNMSLENLSLMIEQLEFCLIIDCTQLSLAEQLEISYLIEPKSALDAFTADVILTRDDPALWLTGIPWEVSLPQQMIFIHQDFPTTENIPVCDTNGPYVAECGMSKSVLLDGSGSYDLDVDDILTYKWTGPFIESPVAGVTAEATFLELGSFVVDLRVDDGVAENSCPAYVNVEDTLSPILDAPENITAECTSIDGQTVDLGTATVSDICDTGVELINDAPGEFLQGMTTVIWTATDDADNVTTDTQVVIIEDTQPPVVTCNSTATITPPDAPISFSAYAEDQCQGPLVSEIIGYDCFTFTKKGKRIDKTESCVVSYSGDTLTIEDSGGVGDHIEWTVVAVDDSGNTITEVCAVEVVKPHH